MQSASKNFISNLKKQKRENKSLLFLDNVKIIKDSIAKGVIDVKCVLTSLDHLDFDVKTSEIYHVDDSVIESLADTKTPQKVLCIAYHLQHDVVVPTDNFLVLDGLQDPGNVGTLIRTAKATGFESVFLVDCVKKSNSKLIRSSVGAVFDSNVFEMSRAEFLAFAEKHHLNLVACDMDGESLFDFQAKVPSGFVVGSEGQGVSKEMLSSCKSVIKIPMKEGIESLNAGVSGAIVMYFINKDRF